MTLYTGLPANPVGPVSPDRLASAVLHSRAKGIYVKGIKMIDNSRAFMNYDSLFDPPDDDYREHEEGKINDLRELMFEVEGIYGDDHPSQRQKRIARRLYKGTSCDISFWVNDDESTVVSTGYCEGSDGECPAHSLDFPFTAEAFWAEVEQADKDGIEEWNRTHGCPACYPANNCTRCKGTGVEPGEEGNHIQQCYVQCDGLGAADLDGQCSRPVNPDCVECSGGGLII